VSAPMAAAAGHVSRLDREDKVLAGVCAAIARHYGISVRYVRVGFVLLTLLGGIGVALYGFGYVVMTSSEETEIADPTAIVREAAASWREGLGAGILAGAVVVAVGGGWHVALPVGVGVASAVVLARSGMTLTKRGRVGAALTIVGAILVARALPALGSIQSFAFPVIVLLAGSVMLFGPWWLRMERALTTERTARIRAQERAEVAAHLHDSVLQTLALIQRRADDPAEVAQLARRQERDLRAWLNADETAAAATLHGALVRAAREIEEGHGVEVEVVCVGDRPLDGDTAALAAAAREAMLNAAKFAGAGRIDVYAEASDERAEVFVRDRGAGFDSDAVPADRRGVRESIIGRMERHGGRAEVRSQPGGGTEVELSL
jgi:signal transduction histidine kinase